MLSNVVAIQNRQRTIRVSTGLKRFLLTGLTAVVLSLGTGVAVAGAVAAVLGATAGGLGVAYQSCQRVETNLAGDLGLHAATLRTTDPAALAERVAAQRAAGALTTYAANRATDRVEAYVGCRQLFLTPTPVR